MVISLRSALPLLGLLMTGCFMDWDTQQLPPGEGNGDASLAWSWTVEGHDYDVDVYEAMCATLGSGSAESCLIVGFTHGSEDRLYCTDCSAGNHTTPLSFDSGDTVWINQELRDSDGHTITSSESWTSVSLLLGSNDLGETHFDLGDYGPLTVEIQWETGPGSGIHGDCDSPPEAVASVGYLLRTATGEPVDEVDVSTNPAPCTASLMWIELPFSSYTLVMEGHSSTDLYGWNITCTDLIVNSEAENSWTCQISMTDNP